MQLITLLAYIEAPPTLSPSGDTQAAAFTAQVAAYKHDEPPMLLRATVWGDAADRAAANIRANSYWVLSGQFRIEKGQLSAALAATPKSVTSSPAAWSPTSPWR